MHFIGAFLKNILLSFEIRAKWETLWSPFASLSVVLLFALHFLLFVLSLSHFFWFQIFFHASMSPCFRHKGLKLSLLQATQVE